MGFEEYESASPAVSVLYICNEVSCNINATNQTQSRLSYFA
jgi:hypothetical protein